MIYSFSNIPEVLSAQEIIDIAFKRAKRINLAKHPDKVAMFRNWDIEKLKTMERFVKETFTNYIKKFPDYRIVDDFHKELMDVLIDVNSYRKSLYSLKWANESITRLTTSTIKRLEGTRDMDDFIKIMRSYFGRFSSYVEGVESSLDYLRYAKSMLSQIPDVDPDLFTIVVAGFPNVGKSELVNKISSGRSEVAPYPFTTKGIIVGHANILGRKIQVVDTPGLLDRELEERNSMEKQAILALRYLADLIIFILDPSETCGYTTERQMKLYNQIKSSFPTKIIFVENKADIFKSNSDNLKISAKTGENIEILMKLIENELGGKHGRDNKEIRSA